MFARSMQRALWLLAVGLLGAVAGCSDERARGPAGSLAATPQYLDATYVVGSARPVPNGPLDDANPKVSYPYITWLRQETITVQNQPQNVARVAVFNVETGELRTYNATPEATGSARSADLVI